MWAQCTIAVIVNDMWTRRKTKIHIINDNVWRTTRVVENRMTTEWNVRLDDTRDRSEIEEKM